MQFGIFDHLDRGEMPLKEFYESRLKLIEAYDQAGFDAYHLAEQHRAPRPAKEPQTAATGVR
jgi:alkanesulfonate monooxygenase SsuD/methylene tetrahydromethanopterin reductase-like flavin-dependent oxidoreductase (luciferase family)